LFAQQRSRRQARLATDEQRADRSGYRFGKRVEIRHAVIPQPQHHDHVLIHVIVAQPSVWGSVGWGPAAAPFGLTPSGPPPVVLLKLRILGVGEKPGGMLVIRLPACREDEPF